MIYAVENQNFKIKDSHGVKYEIPIDRPDFYQVITVFISNFNDLYDAYIIIILFRVW